MIIRIKQVSLILICCCIVQISFAQKKEKKESKAKDKTENIKVRPAVEKTRQVELKNLAYWLASLQITPSTTPDYTELFTGRIDEKYVTSDESIVLLKNMYGHTLYKINLKYNGKYPLSGNIYKLNQDTENRQCIESCKFSLEYNKNNLIQKIQYIPVNNSKVSGNYVFNYTNKAHDLLNIEFANPSNLLLKYANTTNNYLDTLFIIADKQISITDTSFIAYKYNSKQQITYVEKRDSIQYSSSHLVYKADSITPLLLINSEKINNKYMHDTYKFVNLDGKTIRTALIYNKNYTDSIGYNFLNYIDKGYIPFHVNFTYNDSNECILREETLKNQCTDRITNTRYTINEEGFTIKSESTSTVKNSCRL